MKKIVLSDNESALSGTNYQVVVTADDLTQASTNTAQSINLLPLAIGDVIRGVITYLRVPFQNRLDAAFNSDTVSIGDGGSVTQYTAAAEKNQNGSFVLEDLAAASTWKVYTVADNLVLTMNSMVAKALVNLDIGEIHVIFNHFRPSRIALARAPEPITTKT